MWIPTYEFASMFNQPYLQGGNLEFRYLFSATRLLDFTYLSNTKLAKNGCRSGTPRTCHKLQIRGAQILVCRQHSGKLALHGT
ncbi:hypothetical protein ACFTAO_39225 [Paenibacillus rhizoplanae]